MRPGLHDLRVMARHAPGWIFDQTLVARIACSGSIVGRCSGWSYDLVRDESWDAAQDEQIGAARIILSSLS